MANLGLWTPYIDEPEMYIWYQLPTELQQELETYTPDGTELQALTGPRFAEVKRRVAAYANASVAALNLPYHNAGHFELTERRGLAGVAMYERLTGWIFPLLVKQVYGMALRTHDCHHCGSSLRAMAPRPELLYRPDLGVQVSAEWISALATQELGRQLGLVVPARVFQTMVIWTSTYGGETPAGQALGIPDVKPQGFWGCLMRAADVCPLEDFVAWTQLCHAAMYGEVLPVPPPLTRADYVTGRLGFLSYIEYCFDRLDEVAGIPLTVELGWRATIQHLRQDVQRLADGDYELWRMVNEDLARYGRHL